MTATTPARSAARHAEPVTAREVVIERTMDAPARLLFLAYSKPEHMKAWFGPRPYPLTRCEMDFRVGGEFRMAMTGPDGQEGPRFGGRYLAIVPDEKIVYDNGFLVDDGAFAPPEQTMIVTITFAEQADGRTRLTVHTLFGSIAMFEEHTGAGFVAGTSLGLDQLAVHVAAQQKQGG